MKKLLLLATTVLGLGLAPAFAQGGPGGGLGPNLGGAVSKIFEATPSFSATEEFQAADPSGNNVTVPGKISFDGGKSRFEMNISEVKGSQMSPAAAQQMKAMGMDTMISVLRPDQKLAYVVYPGLNSYAIVTSQDTSNSLSMADYKSENAELGKETVGSHNCVKEKVTVTDKDGKKSEFTVWKATDLKNFPVKIISNDKAQPSTMTFNDVSFTKPTASLFEAPSGYTKYDDAQTMLQTEMMKKLRSMAPPPAH